MFLVKLNDESNITRLGEATSAEQRARLQNTNNGKFDDT